MFNFVKFAVITIVLCSEIFTKIDSFPWQQQTEGNDCDVGYSCQSLSLCNMAHPEYEALFPCNGDDNAEIKVCCPVEPGGRLDNKYGPIDSAKSSTTSSTTARPRSTTPKTKAPTIKVTTPKPKTTTPYIPFTLNNRWDNIPGDLQGKLSLLPDDCGRFSVGDKILNGMDASLAEFPWMALVGYKDSETDKPVFFCGGSLINKRYILTAAHCHKAGNHYPTVVRLGEWNIESDKDCVKLGDGTDDCADDVVDVPIETFIKHETFGNRSYPSLRFDVALIRMEHEVEFTDFIHPICLTSKLHRNPHQFYTVTGWGVTDNDSFQPHPILQTVNVKLFDFNECNAAAPAEVSPLTRNGQFCAGGVDGQDACRGDSGGPISYNLHNKEYQKGIVSLSTSLICGREGRPTVYSEVAMFMKWILKNMEP